jgi:predicted transcriptional regulator
MVGKARSARVTGDQREELARQLATQYVAGASIRELSASTGRSYGFIHRMLTDADVPLRGRGGATRDRASRLAAG